MIPRAAAGALLLSGFLTKSGSRPNAAETIANSFFQDLHIARADGSYGKVLTRLAKYSVLIIDDWGLAKFNDKERRDILEVLEERHNITSRANDAESCKQDRAKIKTPYSF